MKIIKLNKYETSTLRELNNSVISEYMDKGQFVLKSSSLLLTLAIADLHKITDELSNIMVAKGITDDEINQFGRQIDDLIDIFNPYI